MNQIPDVPVPPGLTRRFSRSGAGRAWLAALPRLVSGCLSQWGLEPDLAPGAFPWEGRQSMVLPVRRTAGAGGTSVGREEPAGTSAVLKISYPHDEAALEGHALRLWAGNGAVRLLASDEASGALLLERLDAGHSLQDTRVGAALSLWGGLVRRLSLAPDLAPEGLPEWRAFDHVAARAEQWSDELPAAWEELARPFPRWLLEAALEVCQVRGAVGRRAGKDVLVHTDLHYRKVLARPGATDFAAIGPRPMVGEAEFAVAPLLWHRIWELDRSHPQAALLARCRDASTAAGLDAEAARQWSLVREVDNALRYAAGRQQEGDLARSLWVASTLAGRTLPELPAAHALPAPEAPLHP